MKKSVYAITGAGLLVFATLVGRIDGPDVDLVLLVSLGIILLVASAELPQSRRSA